MSAESLLKAVTVTAELTGSQLSSIALAAMVEELMAFDEQAVVQALLRCRRELRPSTFTLGAVVDRIDDGRPGSDEAWAIAMDAQDEALTVVWNAEIQQAFAVARPVLDGGDKIGARMAFKNAYERMVAEARQQRRPAAWSPSLGWDQDHRQAVLERAVETGKLTARSVAGLLPSPRDTGVIGALLLGDKAAAQRLVAQDSREQEQTNIDEDIVRRCSEIKTMLADARDKAMQKREQEAAQRRADFEQRRADALAKVAERTRESA